MFGNMDDNYTFSDSERAYLHQMLDYLLDRGFMSGKVETSRLGPNIEDGHGYKETKYLVKIEVKKDIIYSVF